MYKFRRILAACVLSAVTITVSAQWRLGVYAGIDHCNHDLSNGYAYTNQVNGKNGGIFGIMGQYNFCDWFGVRADINLQNRNYNAIYSLEVDKYRYRNTYLTLPLLANFSFGSQQLRGYVNAGGYIAHWVSKKMECLQVFNMSSNDEAETSTPSYFGKADRRFDAGLAGSLGISYLVLPELAINAEGSIYYGLVNSHNTGSSYFKQPAYDTTLGLTIGVAYIFGNSK